MDILEQSFRPLNNAYEEYKRNILFNNYLILISTAVCIGFITKDTAKNIFDDVLLPIIYFIINKSIIYNLYSKTKIYFKNNEILFFLVEKMGFFIWNILLWFIMIYSIFILFNYIIKFGVFDNQINLIKKVSKYIEEEKNQPKNKENNSLHNY
jgi:membrane protease YdiL (CAAX protease family)